MEVYLKGGVRNGRGGFLIHQSHASASGRRGGGSHSVAEQPRVLAKIYKEIGVGKKGNGTAL